MPIYAVLFSIAGTIGDTAIVKKEHLPMNTNQAIALIRPIEKLNSEFLRRLLSSSISNETTNKQRGGAIKNVSLGDIKELELPLPPLQTQQKVVSYLDEISNKMEKIKNLQKAKMQSLKELKASILDKAFKGEL
ncbi:restriction endonuclease subunit S [Aliarcobacter cryaerophilus]|uniref:restriction endonuclease subunit S n=1 Tax=Aliarcobacter cryaerophilus TaxID=28198 RepID=UPI0028CB63A0|nr:restriction endonuclease subunit S [Aliarcobacter cryaerophilus]